MNGVSLHQQLRMSVLSDFTIKVGMLLWDSLQNLLTTLCISEFSLSCSHFSFFMSFLQKQKMSSVAGPKNAQKWT